MIPHRVTRHEEICPELRLRILLALLHWAGSTFNQSQVQTLRDMLKVVAWIPVADRCLGDIISFSHFQATSTGHFMLFPYFHISIHQNEFVSRQFGSNCFNVNSLVCKLILLRFVMLGAAFDPKENLPQLHVVQRRPTGIVEKFTVPAVEKV